MSFFRVRRRTPPDAAPLSDLAGFLSSDAFISQEFLLLGKRGSWQYFPTLKSDSSWGGPPRTARALVASFELANGLMLIPRTRVLGFSARHVRSELRVCAVLADPPHTFAFKTPDVALVLPKSSQMRNRVVASPSVLTGTRQLNQRWAFATPPPDEVGAAQPDSGMSQDDLPWDLGWIELSAEGLRFAGRRKPSRQYNVSLRWTEVSTMDEQGAERHHDQSGTEYSWHLRIVTTSGIEHVASPRLDGPRWEDLVKIATVASRSGIATNLTGVLPEGTKNACL